MSSSFLNYIRLSGVLFVNIALGDEIHFEAETNGAFVPYACVALNNLTEHLTTNSRITMFCDSSVKDAEKRLLNAALVQDKGYQHRLEFRHVEETLNGLTQELQPIWQNINTIMNDDGRKLFIALRSLFPVLFAEEEHTVHLDMDMTIHSDLWPLIHECYQLPQPVVSALLDAKVDLFGPKETVKWFQNTSVSGGFVIFNWGEWSQVLQTYYKQPQENLRQLGQRWLTDIFTYVRYDGTRHFAYWESQPHELLSVYSEELLFNGLLRTYYLQRGRNSQVAYFNTSFNSRTTNQLTAQMLLEFPRKKLTEEKKEALKTFIAGDIHVWHYDHEPKPLTFDTVRNGTPGEKFFQTLTSLLQGLPQEANQELRRIIREVSKPSSYVFKILQENPLESEASSS